MTQDFLAIPSSRVTIETLFSSSYHDVTSSLGADMISKSILSKQWMKEGLKGELQGGNGIFLSLIYYCLDYRLVCDGYGSMGLT